MQKALEELKDPKDDLYCVVRQFYAEDKRTGTTYNNAGEIATC